MTDVRLLELAGRQHRCVSREQLLALGMSWSAIAHRLETGRLLRLHEAVYAVAPLLEHDKTRWMAATLTEPATVLCGASAAAIYGFRGHPGTIETVVRPGSGGPRLIDGVLVFRSRSLPGWTTMLDGIPVTTPERTLIDLAPHLGDRELARAVREAIRLGPATASSLFAVLRAHAGRRGVARLDAVTARYAGIPLRRRKSDAEALAHVILREAGRPAPDGNRWIEGEEADLVWWDERLIIELDGPQFHLDASEDLRKQRIWEAAGWRVERLPTDDVYLHPERLLAIAPLPRAVAAGRASTTHLSGAH